MIDSSISAIRIEKDDFDMCSDLYKSMPFGYGIGEPEKRDRQARNIYLFHRTYDFSIIFFWHIETS